MEAAMEGQLVVELERIVGKKGVLSSPEELLVYEYDASVDRAKPQAVVLPTSSEQERTKYCYCKRLSYYRVPIQFSRKHHSIPS